MTTECQKKGCCGPCDCCLTWCCPTEPVRKNVEVAGFLYDRAGGTLQFICILSFLPAIAVFAKRDGGCYQACLGDDNWDLDDTYSGSQADDVFSNTSTCYENQCELPQWYCDDPGGTVLCKESTSCNVFGAKPTNIISLVATVSGLTCAVLMPFIGAIVDYSTKRWEVTAGTMALLLTTNLIQCFLSEDTWFPLTIIQGTFGGGAYMAHQVCLFAYIPELSRDPSDVPKIMTATKIYETVAILGFFVLGLGLPLAILAGCGPDKEITGAVIGQILVVVIGAPLSVLGISMMRKRPALHELAPGETLATIGILQVGRTFSTLRSKYPNLLGFFAGYTLWEAATGAVTTITGQYVIEQLTGLSFTMVAVPMILCIIPGAMLALYIAKKQLLTSKQSVMAATVLFTFSILMVACFAHSPETANAIFPFVPFIGIANGWIYPAQRNLLFELIPGGCEAEMMGFFQTCSQILSWLPPLTFIVMGNAMGGDLRWALVVVPILHTLGAITLFFACDVEQGKKDIADTMTLRHYGEAESGASKLDGVELTNVMATTEDPESSIDAISSTKDRNASVGSL